MKELFIVYLRKAKRVLCYLNTCFRGRRVSETGIINYCRSRPHRASQARQREIPPTAPITMVCLQLSEVLLAVSDRSSLPGPRGQCAVQVSGRARRTPPHGSLPVQTRIPGQQKVSKWFLFWVMVFLVIPQVCEPLFCVSNNRDIGNLATCFTVVSCV